MPRTLLNVVEVLVLLLLIALLLWFLLRPEGARLEPMEGTGDEAKSCGTFRFADPDVWDTYSRNGIRVELGFDFDPNMPACNPCGSIAFIQIVRTQDLKNPKRFYYPSTQKKQRATSSGWYIDRGEGFKWIHYGRDDSGDFHSAVTEGNASRPAVMRDRPYRPERHPYLGIRWQAVTAPVCRDENKCVPQGYYAWSWNVTESGTVEQVKKAVARESLRDDVEEAVEQWNRQAVAWGTEPCPPVTSPPAITEK